MFKSKVQSIPEERTPHFPAAIAGFWMGFHEGNSPQILESAVSRNLHFQGIPWQSSG